MHVCLGCGGPPVTGSVVLPHQLHPRVVESLEQPCINQQWRPRVAIVLATAFIVPSWHVACMACRACNNALLNEKLCLRFLVIWVLENAFLFWLWRAIPADVATAGAASCNE